MARDRRLVMHIAGSGPMRHAFAVTALVLLYPGLATGGSDGDRDRLTGLLSLPQLFGDPSCVSCAAGPLQLFAGPDSVAPIGEARVIKPGEWPEDAPCTLPEIAVYLSAAEPAVQEFPTMDYARDKPGAIVLARRGDRFKIALQQGAAWAKPAPSAEFRSLETLVSEYPARLTRSWDGAVCAAPGDRASCAGVDFGGAPPGVDVLGHRTVDGESWVEVRTPATGGCAPPATGTPRVRGWIRAHDRRGNPAVWFDTRGC